MRWQDFRRSDNVEESTGGGSSGIGGMHLGIGGVIVVIVISLLLGKNPLDILQLLTDSGAPTQTQTQAPTPSGPPGTASPRDEQKEFVARVLGDTEDVWTAAFQQSGKRYQPPKLDLFRGQVGSACGLASAATGPFYCPGDRKVYLDLEFFQQLSKRFGAPGDFARAYVIAHEVGHHVQNQLGLMAQVQQKAEGASDRARNDLSVRQELQADCFAGIWGHSAQQRGLIDAKDVESGIAAASAVGDDRLQQRSRGYVVPESFTHGSSAQRVRWFKAGLDSGDMRRCDTFGAREL
ncbi:MAG: zinc metallopeptidase [Pseudomonadota bacterium]|nr:zinc metallopeptidase [Pseudomonadota bacterium]